MYEFVRSLIGAGLIGYLVLCALLYFYQRNLIYYPTPERPLIANDFSLQRDDIRLVVRARQTQHSSAVIYFGGNAEDISFSLDEYQRMLPDNALYAMHYRGYGGSDGKPAEADLVEDALYLYDEVASRHDQVIVVGRSLGSGIAMQLAAAKPVDRLVLITPFDSLLKVAQQRFPIVPVGWLMLDRYESWRFAPDIQTPTLLIVAENDEIIPLVRAEQLLQAFRPGIASLRVLPGLGHNSAINLGEFIQ